MTAEELRECTLLDDSLIQYLHYMQEIPNELLLVEARLHADLLLKAAVLFTLLHTQLLN
jgi:hypothetical protein